jgi:hypothetical protein
MQNLQLLTLVPTLFCRRGGDDEKMRQILRDSKHPGMKAGQLGVDKEGGADEGGAGEGGAGEGGAGEGGAGEGGAGEGGAGEGGAVETVILFPSETALTVEEYRTKSPSFLSDNNEGGDDEGGDDKGGDDEGVGRTAAENGVGVTNIIVFDGTWSNVR